MLWIMPLALLAFTLPDPSEVETVTAGGDVEMDITGGEAWIRILEEDYVCLRVSTDSPAEMRAFDEYGNILCAAEPGSDLLLSAFSDYWFYVSVIPAFGNTGDMVRLRVEEMEPEGVFPGGGAEGVLGRNAMAETFTFTPEVPGSWTFRLEGTGGTDLDLEVYGTGMRLWGSSMSLEGFETVTLSMLPTETATVVVSRYGKAGTGEFTLSVEPSGQFREMDPAGETDVISPGETHRFRIPVYDSYMFLDMAILSPGADVDLLIRDGNGDYLMGSQSYSSLETVLLGPSGEAAVADVVLFDPGENQSVSYRISARPTGAVHSLIPVEKMVDAGSGSAPPLGFSPPAGGLFRIGALFEKTRDGDLRLFRGEGEPALTFATSRGNEEFLVHVAAGDTVWLDPFFAGEGTGGPAELSISSADATLLDGVHLGTISEDAPAAFLQVHADSGTILDIDLSADDREVDLDLFVSGPGLDLVAEGWMSSVDGAGDEAVEVYADENADYGVTVYLYDRQGETGYRLEVNRIRRTELAEPSPLPEVWALCAGISGYPSAADVLNRASMDAVEFYGFLVEEQGVPPDHVILLVDALSTAEEFTDGMAGLLERAGPEDRVVVFYSGHGDRSHPGSGGPEEGDSANEYLCLYDDDVSDDTIAALVDSLARAPVFLFFDACHSGGFVNDFSPGSGVMVLTAAREDLSVSERILTPILLQGSRGDADEDGNGYVSALELMGYIDQRLQLICPECDAELAAGVYVCPQCGAVLKGDNAVPRPEQGMFLTEDIQLWRTP